MTDDQILAFAKDIDNLADKYRGTTEASADTNLEVVLYAIGEFIALDLRDQPHEIVQALLQSAREHVERAAFDYYASFK